MEQKSTTGNPVFEENFIRREKRRKLDSQKEIEKMRADLPQYDLNQIREYKLPFYQALLLRLDETGYVHTSGYINQLFDLQESDRQEAGPQSNTWNLPILRHSVSELRKLSEALMIAEDQHNNGNYRGESEALLRLAIDFCFNYNDWFWLSRQLMLQCIQISTTYKTTGKHEAIVRYVYGRIFIEKAKDYEPAEEQLIISRELSKGKSWNLKDFFPDKSSTTLFMNVNYLLHLCYLRHANSLAKSDPQKAIEYAVLAKKRASEACFYDGETQALFLKGQCELSLGDTNSAVSSFNKAYYIQVRLKSDEGICEARVELSKAYLMHGNTRLALQNLKALKQMAEERGFQFYLAQAYRYLGEYFLNSGEPNKATPLLSNALNIFHAIQNMAEADQVRNLEALSAGLELMPEYISLLQKTDHRRAKWFDNLMKLVMWKDSRQPFWKDVMGSKFDQAASAQVQFSSHYGMTEFKPPKIDGSWGATQKSVAIQKSAATESENRSYMGPSLVEIHKGSANYPTMQSSEAIMVDQEEVEQKSHDLA